MRYSKRIFAVMVAAVLALAPACAMVGCGGTSDGRTVIGSVADESLDLGIVNGLGSEAKVLAVRMSDSGDWGDNLLVDGATMPVGEEMRLGVTLGEDGGSYDLRAVTADGSFEFLGVPLAEASRITLKFEDDVAYVDYVTADGKEASTKEAALAKKASDEAAAAAEEEAAAQAEAEAKAKAEEEAKAAAEAEEAAAAEAAAAAEESAEEYYEDESYDEWYDDSYYEYESEEYYEEPSQSEDYCLDDVAWKD